MPNTANATWTGPLQEGTGKVRLGQGAFEGSYSFKSRFEDGDGTNPEELVAAAHAACFAMSLSNEISQAGGTPHGIEVSAEVDLGPDQNAGGFILTAIRLTGTVEQDGLDEAGFRKAVDAAEAGCPVSKALAAVDITVDITPA